MLIDCHVHLDTYRNEEVSEVLERGRSAGVEYAVTAGTTLASSRRAVELSSRFAGLLAGVGIHPMNIEGPVNQSVYEELLGMALSTDRVVTISEIGLDFMEGAPDHATQFQAFREQIRLARELALPIVFHSRESHEDVLRVLREERAYEVGGAMHYFQADEATARAAIDLGFHISLARPLLRLPHLQALAARLPLEWIVLETDAAPQPFKSKRENWTEPRHVRDVAHKLASLQGVPFREIERVTTHNATKMLGARWQAATGHAPDPRAAGPFQ